jgi:hypothetical protein
MPEAVLALGNGRLGGKPAVAEQLTGLCDADTRVCLVLQVTGRLEVLKRPAAVKIGFRVYPQHLGPHCQVAVDAAEPLVIARVAAVSAIWPDVSQSDQRPCWASTRARRMKICGRDLHEADRICMITS